jgi:diguanylate cyclase (GGDEF)-like protein
MMTYACFRFKTTLEQREYNLAVEALLNQANQTQISIQNKLTDYINVLQSVAKRLNNKELHSDRTMEILQETVDIDNFDIMRLGIADLSGLSYVTNGKQVDVSDRTYFQKSLQGETVITDVTESKIIEDNVFFVSVPVYDANSKIKGVLYGVIETSSFSFFTDNNTNNDMYIHIIDEEGEFVYRTINVNSILSNENFFTSISKINSDLSIDEIKEKAIKNNEEIYFNVSKNDDKRVIYITPIESCNWYVLSVIKTSSITAKIAQTQQDVIILILEIIFVISCLLLAFYIYARKNKEIIKSMDSQLDVMDEAIRIAISESNKLIFSYDIIHDQLKFLSNHYYNKDLPRVIDHPAKFLDEIWNIPLSQSDLINKIREGLKNKENKLEYELVLGDEEKMYFMVEINYFYDEKNKPFAYVGLVDNITNQKENELSLIEEVEFRNNILSDELSYMEIDLSADKILRCSQNILYNVEESDSFSTYISSFCEKYVCSPYKEFVKEAFSSSHLINQYYYNQSVSIEYECTDNQNKHYWSQTNIHLKNNNGHIIALATIRNITDTKMKEISLTRQAEIDYLTGVYNRNAGIRLVKEKLSKKPKVSYTFAIIDIDHFKQINDQLGHIYGDIVLKDVVKILTKHFKKQDIIFRLGGDEFVIFLENAPSSSLDNIFSSLIKNIQLSYGKKQVVTITASLGAVYCEDSYDFKVLYELADKMLYEVKNNNKNGYKYTKINDKDV